MALPKIRQVFGLTAVVVLVAVAPPAQAKDDKKKKDDKKPAAAEPAPAAEPATPAAAQPATPGAPTPPPPPTPEQQQAAVAAVTAGQAAEKAGDLDGAIAKYEEAFAIYPDPQLQFLIGETYRKKGEKDKDTNPDQAIASYDKAITYFQKYVEMAPADQYVAAAKQRVDALTQGIANLKQGKADAEAAAKASAAAAAKQKADAEAARQIELEGHPGTQVALDITFAAGTEPDLTGIARVLAGGLLGWGKFAFEGHLTYDRFLLPSGSDAGVSASSFTILDLGARYAFKNDRMNGPFASGGAGFGFLGGKPRERRLSDAPDVCMGLNPDDPGKCAFSIDKDISLRVGLGYGFASSKQTTVAARLDFTYWLFSVDADQVQGQPAAGRVDKPQTMMSVLIGLEFMHWK